MPETPHVPNGEANPPTRRHFLRATGLAGGLLLASGCAAPGLHAKTPGQDKAAGEEDVSPGEDLMREHGVLKRILLIYGEGIRRIDAKEDLPPEAIASAAKLIRTFIEDYHEKLEEDHLFPRFRKAGKLVDLVDVLQQQHQAGRRVTNVTLRLATAQALRNADDRRRLVESMRQFIRMYSPHEAREDTVLFPALHQIVSRNEYDALGEDFEKLEHQKLGAEGFEKAVGEVERIEKTLGIYDLSQFTPKG